MPIVKAQCTNCGAPLEVDNTKETAVCPFCNTPYIVEKVINNYASSQSSDHLNQSGNTFLQLKEFKRAEKVFEKLRDNYPFDYRGW